MKMQYLAGGLANQIRQYVFVRGQERRHPGERWIYDDSYFFGSGVLHNGYELESVFGLKLDLLSSRLEKASLEKLVRLKEKGLSVPAIFFETGNPIVLVNYYKADDMSFHGIEWKSHQMPSPELPFTNIYYQEYWAEDRWFMDFKEENRAELAFPPLRRRWDSTYRPEQLMWGETLRGRATEICSF